MAKKTNLRELSNDELNSRLNNAREELMNLRFQQVTGELADFNRMSVTRREIARLLTLLHERNLSVSTGGEK